MNQEKLGKYLVNLRKEKGLTQKEVARQIGVTEQAVSKWERGIGTPDIGLWNNICLVFGIEPIELLQGGELQKNEQASDTSKDTQKFEEYNDMLKQTIEISNTEINKMKIKESILLSILSIGTYITSLITQNNIVNIILFIIASFINIYLLGYFLRKKNYTIKFLIIASSLSFIILGYSFFEKISLVNRFRQPIFSIKEIYKEYNVIIYNALFYKAYNCNKTSNEISLLKEKEIDKICATDDTYNTEQNVTLKSGAIITNEQKLTLELFTDELYKKGYIDYNYMRQEDIDEFWKYVDENFYCGTYDTNQNSNLAIKRKNGICQYDNEEYYYCSNQKNDGTIEYKKAKNKQCNGK